VARCGGCFAALFVPPPADASPFVVACVKETGLKLKHLYWPTHARLLEFVAGAATALALARRELRVKQQRSAASQDGDNNAAKRAQGSLFGELRFSLLFALLAMQFTCLVPLLGNYPDHASSLVRRVSLALNRPVFALLFCCTLYELLRPDLALRSARLVARVLSWRALYPLSVLSFGVYLCHMLVCGWLLIPPGAALNLTFEQLQARPWLTLAYGCVVYAVANVWAAVLHLFVERPAIALGSRLLRGPAAASAPPAAASAAAPAAVQNKDKTQ
jgi:peptidoglycan/LPS O-acetylase OafA/YrhL